MKNIFLNNEEIIKLQENEIKQDKTIHFVMCEKLMQNKCKGEYL